ncbi:MAG: hypothetical protein HYT10_03350 [Candidatus Levybacteria bacterium]|nr:hypothetical protein [Candidatus Levybacteria bacterium]
MIDKAIELSPTIKALDTKRDTENLSGSPLTRRKNLFGKEFSFYDDGSVLVVDPTSQEYHFITQEGREKGRELRRSAEEIISNDQRLGEMKMLGEGKGGFSRVFELDTPAGPIAVKATDKAGFFLKELMEEATKKAEYSDPLSELTRRQSGKKIVQKMSLTDTMRLFRKLDEAGIRKPEFYGFSVRRNPGNNEIQEFQFMERIDRPTVESILEAAIDAEQNQTGGLDPSKFAYTEFLADLSDKYFRGDNDALMKAIVRSFRDFVRSVKEAVPNIADLEMDNIFLVGYDETDQQLEFMLIDPIEENVYIRPIQSSKTNLINNRINFEKPEKINFPNKMR